MFSHLSCHHPYWIDDNYHINKLGCDWIQAFVLQLARGARGQLARGARGQLARGARGQLARGPGVSWQGEPGGNFYGIL